MYLKQKEFKLKEERTERHKQEFEIRKMRQLIAIQSDQIALNRERAAVDLILYLLPTLALPAPS